MPLEFSSGQVVPVTITVPASSVTVLPLIGPQGPPGPSGGGTYQHAQILAATVWTITHNLGRYPAAVSLYSSNLSESYSEFVVQHLTINSLRVSMDTPTAGVALLV